MLEGMLLTRSQVLEELVSVPLRHLTKFGASSGGRSSGSRSTYTSRTTRSYSPGSSGSDSGGSDAPSWLKWVIIPSAIVGLLIFALRWWLRRRRAAQAANNGTPDTNTGATNTELLGTSQGFQPAGGTSKPGADAEPIKGGNSLNMFSTAASTAYNSPTSQDTAVGYPAFDPTPSAPPPYASGYGGYSATPDSGGFGSGIDGGGFGSGINGNGTAPDV